MPEITVTDFIHVTNPDEADFGKERAYAVGYTSTGRYCAAPFHRHRDDAMTRIRRDNAVRSVEFKVA
tara:strand:+ start:713 stop:913 length:201 start_codon:yes stop_codon:yes gene_type:complete